MIKDYKDKAEAQKDAKIKRQNKIDMTLCGILFVFCVVILIVLGYIAINTLPFWRWLIMNNDKKLDRQIKRDDKVEHIILIIIIIMLIVMDICLFA